MDAQSHSQPALIPIQLIDQYCTHHTQEVLPQRNPRITQLMLINWPTQTNFIQDKFITKIVSIQLHTQLHYERYIVIQSINIRINVENSAYQIDSCLQENGVRIKDIVRKYHEYEIEQMIQSWVCIIKKAIKIIELERDKLLWIDPRCIELYMGQSSDFSLLIGFSCFVENHQCETYDYIACVVQNNFPKFNKVVNLSQIISDYFLQRDTLPPKMATSQQIQTLLLGKSEINLPQQYEDPQEAFHLLLEHYCSYAKFTLSFFKFIPTTFDYVLYNRMASELSYLQQYQIDFIDPLTKRPLFNQPIYVSLNCRYLHGFSHQTLVNAERCLRCKTFISHRPDQTSQKKSVCEYQSSLLGFLSHNFLNPSTKINLSLPHKIFNFPNRTFKNYPHFCEFTKLKNHIRNREFQPSPTKQLIPLFHHHFFPQFTPFSFIKVPIRGKYCKHVGFFDLVQIWLQSHPQISQSFTCPICAQNIGYEQIIYLKEISMLIDILKNQLSPGSVECKGYLKIDHHKGSCELQWYEDSILRHKKLDIYNTIIDPMRRIKISTIDQSIISQYSQFFDVVSAS